MFKIKYRYSLVSQFIFKSRFEITFRFRFKCKSRCNSKLHLNQNLDSIQIENFNWIQIQFEFTFESRFRIHIKCKFRCNLYLNGTTETTCLQSSHSNPYSSSILNSHLNLDSIQVTSLVCSINTTLYLKLKFKCVSIQSQIFLNSEHKIFNGHSQLCQCKATINPLRVSHVMYLFGSVAL